MMRTLDARSFGLLGALFAGAAVALAVMAAAGSDPVVWVAVAGASACACGLVVGTTARVVPAVALAGVAAAALVLAVDGYRASEPTELRAYKTHAVAAPPAAHVVERVEEPAPPVPARPAPPLPPLTRPQFVHRFYAALEAGRFGQAWERLGPAVRARERSFEAWRAGYATTLSQRIEDLRVEAGGNVRHTLVTVDRTPCGGSTERRYEMLWYLDPDGRTFTARDVVGVQLAGLDPALACD
jgi:hypothetical protein